MFWCKLGSVKRGVTDSRQMKVERLTFKTWLSLTILLAGLATLTACQGVSSAGTSNQQQTKVGELSLDSASLSFGTVTVGQSSSLRVTAVNNGTAAVTVSSATPSTPQFALSSPGLPLSVAAGQSTTLSIRFTPSAVGTVSGTMSISSDASTGPVSLSLSGAGASPGSLVSQPASVGFGSVLLGNNQQQAVGIMNSGGTAVTISQIAATGAGFSWSGIALPATVPPGQSATATVTFAPQSANDVSGSLTITSNANNGTLTVPLSGTGSNSPGVLSANPTSLSFSSVQVGNSQILPESLTNNGGSNVTISQGTVTGAAFSVSGFTPPVTLSPGQTYTLNVMFAPQSAGSATGNLSLASDGSNPSLSIGLSGTGLANGSLSVTPGSWDFGSVVVGTSSPLSAKLKATSASVTISNGSSNNGEFVISGISFPLTLQAGDSASFTVTFTPQSSGTANGTLTFTSNASNGPTTESLSGTGSPPPVHSVVLNWTASTSPNISSYDIYRSTTSGGSYTQIGSVTAPTTTFTDSSVTDGVTYYYVATAVNSSGEQSGDSNQATAAIPPP